MEKCSVSFTSRCPQIRAAQEVCRNVSVNFPHCSSTKLEAKFDKLAYKYPDLYDEFINFKPYARSNLSNRTQEKDKIFSIFSWREELIRNINRQRRARDIIMKSPYLHLYNIILQLKKAKVGNCYENAKLSEFILRANGKKNVYTASLSVDGMDVDHVICFFNKDGSKFNGNINKNTIIVDSWLGDADFADNMLLKYRNLYQEELFMPVKGKMTFRKVESLNLSDADLADLKSEFL